MKEKKPKTRTGAAAPQATRHLTENQRRALDMQADAEHMAGLEREKLIRKAASLADSKPRSSR